MRAFISYCHADSDIFNRLMVHLKSLEREKIIDTWSDYNIVPGQDISESVKLNMEHSELFLLLISPDFIASDYCIEKELEYVIKRHNLGTALVVPVIVRPCNWKSVYNISQLKALPNDAKPISSTRNQDKAYLQVIEGIKEFVFNYNQQLDTAPTINNLKRSTSFESNQHINLTNNKDVNISNNEGWHALMIASQEGQIDVVKHLIANGADVDTTNDEGWTALMIASHQGYTEIVELLIANGADVNASEEKGRTALMIASFIGQTEIVKYLIVNGADVNASEEKGMTALIWASGKGQIEIVEFLIANGADVNATEENGRTALIWASFIGQTKAIDYLIANSADVNATDTKKWTALMCASHQGYTEIVELLIANGADVNATEENGRTALVWASDKGYIETVECLIANGADVNATDTKRWTALMCASHQGHKEIAERLIANGADVKVIDNYASVANIFDSLMNFKITQILKPNEELSKIASDEYENNKVSVFPILANSKYEGSFSEVQYKTKNYALGHYISDEKRLAFPEDFEANKVQIARGLGESAWKGEKSGLLDEIVSPNAWHRNIIVNDPAEFFVCIEKLVTEKFLSCSEEVIPPNKLLISRVLTLNISKSIYIDFESKCRELGIDLIILNSEVTKNSCLLYYTPQKNYLTADETTSAIKVLWDMYNIEQPVSILEWYDPNKLSTMYAGSLHVNYKVIDNRLGCLITIKNV